MRAAFRTWLRAMAVVLAALLWCVAVVLWRDADETVAVTVLTAVAVVATALAWRAVRGGLLRSDEPGPPPPAGLL
jgi:hypothetical protein